MGPQTLTADRAGERADAFLARSVPDLTRSAAQRLLEEGAVTRSGRPARKNASTRRFRRSLNHSQRSTTDVQ